MPGKLISVTAVLLAAIYSAGPAAELIPSNGTFEELDDRGLPVAWGPLGQTVTVTDDAHSGKRALRMVRTPETVSRETGVNRHHALGRITALKGGVEFWYKAPVAGPGTELNVYVIPMNAEGVEKTGSLRATFSVPRRHIGDGEWHRSRLRYDFTDNPNVKWLHYAARIVGESGELLLDDVRYLKRVGPIVWFQSVDLDEDPDDPGRHGVLRALVKNAGDTPLRQLDLDLELPENLKAEPITDRFENVPPDRLVRAKWRVLGPRTGGEIVVRARSGELSDQAALDLKPALRIRSLGPVEPVATVGAAMPVGCVIENTGNAIAARPAATFGLPDGPVVVRTDEVAPGRSVTLSVPVTFGEQAAAVGFDVRVTSPSITEPLRAQSQVTVGSNVALPPPHPGKRAEVGKRWAVLETPRVRLAFRANQFGYGPGELQVKDGGTVRTVAWLPRLGWLAYRAAGGHTCGVTAFSAEQPIAEATAARLKFVCRHRDEDDRRWTLTAQFAAGPDDRLIEADYALQCDKPAELAALQGPLLYALNRDTAIFPGLEWLVDDEVSSSTLDIAAGHPHQQRYIVHPNMVTIPAISVAGPGGTVGLLWDVHQQWDGEHDRPNPVFASPDRFNQQRSHLMGLMVPSVPEWLEANQPLARQTYAMEPGRPVKLAASLLATPAEEPLAAIEAWIGRHGLPEPAPLPHGTYDAEIAFMMTAYLDSLWLADEEQWWTTKGSAVMSRQGRPRDFVADLLVGATVADSESLRRQCLARAERMLELIGGRADYESQRHFGPFHRAIASPEQAAALVASRRTDGSWRFDADTITETPPFAGRDYYQLGPDEAMELGSIARNAFTVLRYVRIFGDSATYRRMLPTLELMARFHVPRAAQVWEVPVHTPDVLAAADAVDAFVEAYRFSGDQQWLDEAVRWARHGLPFIYLWGLGEKPFLVGASIPVFGATWHRGSWFGRPVQWNGLRYANALLKLDQYDESLDWRKLAETIIRSAIHQMDTEGENAALWPDNISAIDSKKCPWVFAPRQVIRNILKLTGRDEDPATLIVGEGERRLHITAAAKIDDSRWDGRRLSFAVTFPLGCPGMVLVSNLAKPESVRVSGRSIEPVPDVESQPAAGWRYDSGLGCLVIRTPGDGPNRIEIQGAVYRRVERLPSPADRIAFEFDQSQDGWFATHHIADLSSRDGVLHVEIEGHDPYLIRPMLTVPAERVRVIELRLKLVGAGGGQLFWATENEPAFGEDRSIRFNAQADGQFHTYRLLVGEHQKWRGTITALRIDPCQGGRASTAAIDYVRGVETR